MPHTGSPRLDPALHVVPGGLSSRRTFTPRQERLLDGLEQIIFAEGFRTVTVANLAAKMRCSRRTLYEVAATKEELVLLVVDRVLYRVGAAGQEAADAQETNLARLAEFLHRGLGELRAVTLRFADDTASDPAVQALIASHFHYGARRVEQIIKDGQAAGEFVVMNPTLLSEALRAGAERLLDPGVLRAMGINYADALDEFMDFVARGMVAPGSAAAGTARTPPRKRATGTRAH